VFLVIFDGMLPIKTVLLNQFDWSKCSHIRLIDDTFRGGIVFVASTTAEYIRKERLDGFEAIHIRFMALLAVVLIAASVKMIVASHLL